MGANAPKSLGPWVELTLSQKWSNYCNPKKNGDCFRLVLQIDKQMLVVRWTDESGADSQSERRL